MTWECPIKNYYCSLLKICHILKSLNTGTKRRKLNANHSNYCMKYQMSSPFYIFAFAIQFCLPLIGTKTGDDDRDKFKYQITSLL